MGATMSVRSTSTTVDLSRLSAPMIVEQKDFETIIAEMVAKVQELLPSFDATIDSEGAPFFDTYAALLEIRVSQVMACRIALAEDLASVAREYGDALSAAIAVTLPGATPRDVLRALAETEEAYSRTGRLLRRLKSFLPLGASSRAGIAGGLQ
jgi:phage-related baseplate assembly protein